MAELADAHGSGYTTSVNLQNSGLSCKITYNFIFAPVAELADAYGSGPYFRKEVQVQFLSGAPKKVRFNRAFCYLGHKKCWQTRKGIFTAIIYYL